MAGSPVDPLKLPSCHERQDADPAHGREDQQRDGPIVRTALLDLHLSKMTQNPVSGAQHTTSLAYAADTITTEMHSPSGVSLESL